MVTTKFYAGKTYTLIGKFTLPDTGESIEIDDGGKLVIKASNGSSETIDIVPADHKKTIDEAIEYQINYTFPFGSEFLTFDWQCKYQSLPIREYRVINNIQTF